MDRAVFRDRRDAGARLAEELLEHRDRDALVLALPRGGVPVAFEVARALRAELDVLVARKLGAPHHPEFGFGAIAAGVTYLDEESVRALGLDEAAVRGVEAAELRELERRVKAYRGDREEPRIEGRTVIVVDDGVATGGTARAALRSVRRRGPARLVFAAPVGPREARVALASEADDVVIVETPEPFTAVGLWYERFDQTPDEEVLDLLARSPSAEVRIPTGNAAIVGTLTVPPEALGLVIFAHGSGSGRFSTRNRHVAQILRSRGFATLLLDLLTPEEERVDDVTREHRFDIPLLARRLADATRWAQMDARTMRLPVGYFGASTGGGAALRAETEHPGPVRAVVSRGGRPDLAGDALPRVQAPTLLIVGGRDVQVIELNEEALQRMRARVELRIVPGATHLFEEPGALEEVAGLAADWFARHFASAGVASSDEAQTSGRGSRPR